MLQLPECDNESCGVSEPEPKPMDVTDSIAQHSNDSLN